MKIMAVVNVTPDSFFDGGAHSTTASAVQFALRCIAQGADILDIGGESSRPGADSVSVDEELRRVIPLLEGIRTHNTTIPISIDTTKAAVLREAAHFNIHYANDITALQGDPEMAATIAQLGTHVILMHMQGTPQTMQQSPHYDDVVQEVHSALQDRITFATKNGIAKDRIVIDPGIGFGKTVTHNVTLLRNLSQLADLGCPMLVGTSRKSFIGKLTNTESSTDRLAGSLATVPAMVNAGVAIVRTHDVFETKQFLAIFKQLI